MESESFLFRFHTTRELTKEDFSQYIGYVPQDDILDRELTVRELLVFNIQTRLPHISDENEIQSIVDNVLSDLAIRHIADSVIGGGENKSANISGGQLKRVNIAVELVGMFVVITSISGYVTPVFLFLALSSPALLLLDEPTAGLDASIAYDLIVSLETVMRHKGRFVNAILIVQTVGIAWSHRLPTSVAAIIYPRNHHPSGATAATGGDL